MGIHLDFEAPLPAVTFRRAPSADVEGTIFLKLNRGVIGVIAVLVFWGDPKPMTAPKFELSLARAAKFFFEFFEDVEVVDEAKAKDARAHVKGEDKFDGMVGDAEVSGPSAIGDDVHKEGLGGMGGQDGVEKGFDFLTVDPSGAEFALKRLAGNEIRGLGESLGFAKSRCSGGDQTVTGAGDFVVGSQFRGPARSAGEGGLEADVAEGFVTGGIEDNVAELEELPPDGFGDRDVVGNEIDSIADTHLRREKLGVAEVGIGGDGGRVGRCSQDKRRVEATFANGGKNLAGELEVFTLGKGAGHVEDEIFLENAFGSEPLA